MLHSQYSANSLNVYDGHQPPFGTIGHYIERFLDKVQHNLDDKHLDKRNFEPVSNNNNNDDDDDESSSSHEFSFYDQKKLPTNTEEMHSYRNEMKGSNKQDENGHQTDWSHELTTS